MEKDRTLFITFCIALTLPCIFPPLDCQFITWCPLTRVSHIYKFTERDLSRAMIDTSVHLCLTVSITMSQGSKVVVNVIEYDNSHFEFTVYIYMFLWQRWKVSPREL